MMLQVMIMVGKTLSYNEVILVIIDYVNGVVNWWDKILGYIKIVVEINGLLLVLCLVRWNNVIKL